MRACLIALIAALAWTPFRQPPTLQGPCETSGYAMVALRTELAASGPASGRLGTTR